MPRRRAGFTLLEAMVSAVLVVIMGITIIALMIQTFKTHQFERERVVALNRASLRVEELKRQLYPTLRGSQTSITLDVNNTPATTSDDINATLYVKLRDRDGNILASGPTGSDSVKVEVTVSWISQRKSRSQTIHTIMTP